MSAEQGTRTRLDAIRRLLTPSGRSGTTHWEGCETAHGGCAAAKLLTVVDAAQAAMSHGRIDGSECRYEGETGYVCDGDCDVAIELWERLDTTLKHLNQEVQGS